jgi:hypothetical protein
MTRRIGPIEVALQRAADAYIQRHGHGSATKLARMIRRTSAWVGLFVNGERRASVDDAVAIARALDLDLHALVDGTIATEPKLDLRPVDRYEQMIQRRFPRLKDQLHRRHVIAVVDSLLSIETQREHQSLDGG